jgi:hypothetical protein
MARGVDRLSPVSWRRPCIEAWFDGDCRADNPRFRMTFRPMPAVVARRRGRVGRRSDERRLADLAAITVTDMGRGAPSSISSAHGSLLADLATPSSLTRSGHDQARRRGRHRHGWSVVAADCLPVPARPTSCGRARE